MKKEIICDNCGASFDQNLPFCPYCGSMSYIGAEQQYLDKLDDVRENLDDVRHQPRAVVRGEAIRQGGYVKKIFIGTGILVLIVLVIFWVTSSISGVGVMESEDETRAQLLWDRENFPQLDAWYEVGDYDALAQFQMDLIEEESSYNLFHWDHIDFLFKYIDYSFYCSIVDRWNVGEELTGYEIGTMLIAVTVGELQLDENYAELTQEEETLCRGYIQEQRIFLIDEIGYTQQELDEIYSHTMKDGSWDVQVCYDAGGEKVEKLYD